MISKMIKETLCGVAVIAGVGAICDYVSNIKYKNCSYSFDKENVENIYINISWGELKIIETNDNNISIEAKKVPDAFNAFLENNKLNVDFNVNSSKVLFKKNHIKINNLPSVFIKIPKKKYYKFELKLDAGITDIKNISTDIIDISCGAGELNIKNVNANNFMNIKGGAGEINISKGILGGLNANLKIGEFDFDGTINGDITVKNSVGDVDINLTNPKSDFNGSDRKYSLNLSKGIGDLNISYDN